MFLFHIEKESKSQRLPLKEFLNNILSKKYAEYRRLERNAQIIIFHKQFCANKLANTSVIQNRHWT